MFIALKKVKESGFPLKSQLKMFLFTLTSLVDLHVAL